MSYSRPKLYGFADGRVPPVISDTRRRVKLDHFYVMPDIRSTPIAVDVKTDASGKSVVVTSDPSIAKPEVITPEAQAAAMVPTAEAQAAAMPPTAEAQKAAMPPTSAPALKAVDMVFPLHEPEPIKEKPPVDVTSSIKEPTIVVPKTPSTRSKLSLLIDKLETSGVRYQIKDLNPALAIAKDTVNPGGLSDEELDVKIVDEAYRSIAASVEGFAGCDCASDTLVGCSVNLYDSRYMSLYDETDSLEDQASRLRECVKHPTVPRELPFARLCREKGIVMGVSTAGYGVEY